MTIFKLGDFRAHSGAVLPWKVDLDDLASDDWACLARVVADLVGTFGRVEGVPRGGLRLADALRQYAVQPVSTEEAPWRSPYSRARRPLLVVDDVLTTGASMRDAAGAARGRDPHVLIKGAVVFARSACPAWVTPVFTLTPRDDRRAYHDYVGEDG